MRGTVGAVRRCGTRSVQRCVATLAAVAVGLVLVGCTDEPGAAGGDGRDVVTVFGTLSDADVDDVMSSLRDFERDTGIDVRYVSSSNFESDLQERLRRGDPPDLALLPQPGVLDTLVEDGFALAWDGELQRTAVEGVDPFLVDLVTFGGAVYGSWYQLTVKSLVWYSPRRFAARGLQVPTTWAELERLTDELAAAGTPPWCIGIRAAGATGWVATDWVEDLVLRFAGPEIYDGWVAGDVRFGDPEIVDAVERFGRIALAPDQVAGGNRAAVEVSVEESANEVLAEPATCLLHRQASFLPRYVPADVDIAPDGDLWAFPLPAVDGGTAPLVVGGSVLVRFSADRDVDRVAAYLSTIDAAARRAQQGGFVSPREDLTLDRYARPLDRWVAELAREAEVVRFDASDLMPPEVGVGAFWSGMTSWLGGARLRSVLDEIDASWPVLLARPAVPEDDGG